MVKNPPAVWETWVWSLGWKASLKEGKATHSSMLAWRIPCTEEPGGLQFMGPKRVRCEWATEHICINWLIFGCAGSLLWAIFSSHSEREPRSSCGGCVSHCGGFSCCREGLGLSCLQLVESSQTRDRTRVPCIGRWILYHWTTREVLWVLLTVHAHRGIPHLTGDFALPGLPFWNALPQVSSFRAQFKFLLLGPPSLTPPDLLPLRFLPSTPTLWPPL